MKYFCVVVITLSVLVTCCNVQAIRDKYAAEESPIELFFVDTLGNLIEGERGGD